MLKRFAARYGIWVGVALFVSAQNLLVGVSRGAPIDLQWDVFHEFVYWSMWALFAQIIVRMVRRWPFDRGVARRSLVPHLVAMLVIAPAQITTTYATHLAIIDLAGVVPAGKAGAWFAARGPGIVWGSFTNSLYYWVIVGVYQAVLYRRLAARLSAELAQAQLDALRTQLQPHFLFNALNSATVLTTTDPARANRVLLKLSELLRATLDRATPHEVPLRQELAQLEPYLEIQQIRFGARLAIARELEPETLDALVPALVLQPLVENAVRHGIEPNPAGGKVTIRSRADNGTLCIEVRDTGSGRAPDPSGSEGIGLTNTRARLVRLYGANHRFELAPTPTGGTAVHLDIPLRRANPAR
ncbi:MAG TPA: histidine kinase [Gemmatimonadales bacterium]|nr:histidine kinase [Gemmatimonadales bacterium]